MDNNSWVAVDPNTLEVVGMRQGENDSGKPCDAVWVEADAYDALLESLTTEQEAVRQEIIAEDALKNAYESLSDAASNARRIGRDDLVYRAQKEADRVYAEYWELYQSRCTRARRFARVRTQLYRIVNVGEIT